MCIGKKKNKNKDRHKKGKNKHMLKKAKRVTGCRNFPIEVIRVLRDWFENNIRNPFPDKVAKQDLISKTGLTKARIDTWFFNARKRKLNLYLDKNEDPTIIYVDNSGCGEITLFATWS